MDMLAVLGVLNDLPTTFKREGAPYTQFVDAVAAAKSLYTLSADATLAQVLTFNNQPQDGWLDTWGLLWGLPREAGEANTPYATRIQETVTAWMCTVPAVQVWINLFAAGGSVTENGSDQLGYVITFPAQMSQAQIIAWLVTFNRIRPAGVPFTILQTQLGLYLNTDAFLGSGSRVLGDYLSQSTQGGPPPIGPTQLSAKPLLPTYLMTDPILNPGLT